MINYHFRQIKRIPATSYVSARISIIITLLTSVFLHIAAAQQSCVEFVKPSQWLPVTTPSCTLSVNACSQVTAINFKTQYVPQNDSVSRIVSIGNLTRRPFKLIWDISKVPNQLTYGITCLVEAEYVNGKIETLRQEGIFLTHHSFTPPEYEIPFAPLNKFNTNRQSLSLSPPSLNSKARVNITWNEKGLMFHIDVTNPLFYTTLPPIKMKKLGTKISIDIQNKRRPYITEDILIFMIPVMSKPYRVIAKSTYKPDGTFDINETYDSCNYTCSVVAENFKGYTISFSIPQKALGTPIPDILGCNVITTVLDENSSIKELSWIEGNHYTIHSPFTYGELILLRKPSLANPILLWFLSFLAGILLGMLGIFLFKMTKKFNTLIRFENAEQEEHLVTNITTIIEAEITNTNFSINDIATKLSLTPPKVNKIVKRYSGRSFRKHLLFSRIEIVKERLRSSNASEISIAKSCGFTSVDEMEKIFHTFTGTTPYRYREENRIT